MLEAATHPIEAFKFYSSFKRPARKLSLNLLLLLIFVSVWFAIFVRKYQDTKCLWFFLGFLFSFSIRIVFFVLFHSQVCIERYKREFGISVCTVCEWECVGGRACVPSRVEGIFVSLWVCLARLMQNDITLMEGELKLKHGGDWQRSRRWRSVQTAHKMATHLQSFPFVYMCVCVWVIGDTFTWIHSFSSVSFFFQFNSIR